MHRFVSILALCLTVGSASLLALADTPADKPYTPYVAPASDEGQKAMKQFRVPEGVAVKLWAAEPLLANPVSFCFDEKGRCFLAETYRLHHGVTDNRNHRYWLDDDLASRTVADRVAMYKKHAKDKFSATYEVEHDRVKLIWDSTGAGVADKATVFADGFHHAEDGLGSGVLARKGNVYYTDIPDLWLLKDTKGEGKADVRQALATGFGVHVAFLGHDMHGLRMGPDGRLYFSIGDRGLNVTTKEGKHLFYPDMGAVLRCEPDGSHLEVVHFGLRNPQELAFDRYGNLFTVDNNSDSGDKARLVYIVEGGDSGWRTGYQYGSSLSDRGPFNAEKIWHLQHEGQAAYVVPPLAHITSGPSGLCYNYGATALPERYKEHFFICDFRGSANGSGVYSFAVKPKGAAFEIQVGHEAFWRIQATDCDFGPDGGLYVSDWVQGWGITGKGRLYRFADPAAEKNPAIGEVKKLLAEGFDQRPIEELTKLLGHADLRVRQEAQFALAGKGKEAIPTLAKVAKDGKDQIARLHAIWGLGQLGRKGEGVLDMLKPLLKDGDEEVRAQTARALGWMKGTAAGDLLPLLKDAQPRVRFQALSTLGNAEAVPFHDGDGQKVWDAAVGLLKENADQDTYLRYEASRVLARYPGKTLAHCSTHESPSVRLAAVLALRQQASPAVSSFLNDTDPKISLEAARVLHDVVGDPQAGKPLADRLNRPGQSEYFTARALNAHFRLGGEENATAIARFAARADAPQKLRIEAVRVLGMWASPPRRDRVTGLTQSLKERDAAPAVNALKANLGGIVAGPEALRREASSVAAKLGIKEIAPVLYDLVADTKQTPAARVEALRSLEALKDSRREKATQLALADGNALVRTEGRRLLAQAKPAEAIPVLARAINEGEVADRQGAFAILAGIQGTEADDLLAGAMARLLKKQLPPEVHLDLLDAAAKHPTAKIKEQLAAFETTRRKEDHLAAYRETLVGGDAERGRNLFLYKSEVTCLKCHKLGDEGGEGGPDLTEIGKKQSREYLLESIVDPNRQIAMGYQTVVVELKNGLTHVGVLKGEDARELRLMTAEGKMIAVPKDQIDERREGKSAMPEDIIKYLSKSELRDLVEFLAGLK
jgi:quinoprotein glucose dehydrogenase